MKKCLKFLLILISALSLFFVSESFAQSHPRFEQPLLITSAGQSADVQIGGVLAKRAGLMATLSKNATYQELADKKTLALVIGVSMKGLGAAGLDLDQEKTRVTDLIEEAQKKDIPILCLHLGGEARRGELSDQMIRAFLPYAQMVIVVKSGNKDGLFTQICTDKKISLLEVDRTSEVQEPLKSIFAPIG
ncbi:MAG: hypothetical protein JSV17_01820 [Candidatus Aminicenantes bacterium]|nr:MAG: hypothetical protein JSV17_01820 [Candidatus Aminicenantes bacterium]